MNMPALLVIASSATFFSTLGFANTKATEKGEKEYWCCYDHEGAVMFSDSKTDALARELCLFAWSKPSNESSSILARKFNQQCKEKSKDNYTWQVKK